MSHGEMTLASVHEAQWTEAIQQALVDNRLPPEAQSVASTSIDAAVFVSSQHDQGITRIFTSSFIAKVVPLLSLSCVMCNGVLGVARVRA
jgi:hypothetical protein